MALITGTSKKDRLIGTVGPDLLEGLDGNDFLNGKEGSNRLEGGAGRDTLRAVSGNDTLDGGDGNDLLLIKSSEVGTYVHASMGQDTIQILKGADNGYLDLGYAATSEFRFPLFRNVEMDLGNKGGTIKKFSASSSDVSTDTLKGLQHLGPDAGMTIGATEGADLFRIDRTDGPAIKVYAAGNDTIEGSAQTYEVVQSPGHRSSYFNAEIRITDSTNGQMSGTITYVDGFDAYTVTFSGIDRIDGSPGSETMIGSTGSDTFRPSQGDDGFDGKRGFDTVIYDYTTLDSTWVDLASGVAVSRFFTDGLRNVDGLRSIEAVIGSDRAFDDFRGNKAGNLLDGAGNDDRLSGRNGKDTLIGGDGDDTLMGGNGRDTFRFDPDDGADRILDFENGADWIEITGGIGFADLEITDFGRHTAVTFEATTVILLKTEHTLIGAEDFLFT